MTLRADQLMTSPLVWADLHDPIHRVEELMRGKKIGAVPVRDESGVPVGVFSLHDLAFYDRALLAGTQKVSERDPIEGWITPRIYSVSPAASLLEIIRMMVRRGVRRVFVRAEESEALLGVITVGDVLRYLLQKKMSRTMKRNGHRFVEKVTHDRKRSQDRSPGDRGELK